MFKGLNEITAPVRTCVSMLADIRSYRKYVSGNLEARRLIPGIGILISVVEQVIIGSVDTQKNTRKKTGRKTDRQESNPISLPLDLQVLIGLLLNSEEHAVLTRAHRLFSVERKSLKTLKLLKT